MDKSIFEKVFEQHKQYLPFINMKNDQRILIAFAAPPGSGKTAISDILEKKLEGNRINSIHIQPILESLKGEKLYDGVYLDKQEYIMLLLTKIVEEYPNKKIILDKGIERTYSEISDWCKNNCYRLFIFALDTPLEILKKRIIQREGRYAGDYLKDIERQYWEYKHFIAENKVNTTISTITYTPQESAVIIESYVKENI